MKRYFDQEYWGRWIGLLAVWILTACSTSATETGIVTTPTENPFGCPNGVQPKSQSEWSYFSPDCSCVTSVSQGFSWHGLTIGKSELQDVRLALGVDGTQDLSDGGWIFQKLDIFEESLPWRHAKACFVDDKLSILFTGGDENTFRKTPEQIVEQHGKPFRVTWGPDFRTRTLIWPEMGFAIFMDMSGQASGEILLFPPMPSEALETSWLMMSLPTESVGSPPEDVDYGSIWETEDLWGIEH